MRRVKVNVAEKRVEETVALTRRCLSEMAGMCVGLSYTVMWGDESSGINDVRTGLCNVDKHSQECGTWCKYSGSGKYMNTFNTRQKYINNNTKRYVLVMQRFVTGCHTFARAWSSCSSAISRVSCSLPLRAATHIKCRYVAAALWHSRSNPIAPG